MTAFLRAVRHLPKVTPSFFAEFLELLSLDHLSLLDQPTCVGMRYGKIYLLTTLRRPSETFLGS